MSERRHRSAEAFCLMKYRTDDASEEEWIWNSRDGVTPFIVRSQSGKEMRHVDWHEDAYSPMYDPGPSERVFVDMPERRRRREGLPEGAPILVVWGDYRPEQTGVRR